MAPKSKLVRSKATQGQTPQTTSNAVPNWPSLEPVPPAMDLELKEQWPDQILTIASLWSKASCSKYVKFLSGLPLTTTPGKPKKGEALRVNDRFQVDDPVFADRVWRQTALKQLVEEASIDGQVRNEQQIRDLWGGEVLGLNSNIRIYRYSKGQFFDQHCTSISSHLFDP